MICFGVVLRVLISSGALKGFNIKKCAAHTKLGEPLICGAPALCMTVF